jgi:phosphoribulokinase
MRSSAASGVRTRAASRVPERVRKNAKTLLGYHTKTMRDCFDVKVYRDPPEDLRRRWKIQRDCSRRNYGPDEVLADLDRRESDSEAFIRPQRQHTDIVVTFHPPGPALDADPATLHVRLVLRPVLSHPYLVELVERTRVDGLQPIRMSLSRDHGKPVDVLEVQGALSRAASTTVERVIWEGMGLDGHELDREAIGLFQDGDETRRSESLALTQLLVASQIANAHAGV